MLDSKPFFGTECCILRNALLISEMLDSKQFFGMTLVHIMEVKLMTKKPDQVQVPFTISISGTKTNFDSQILTQMTASTYNLNPPAEAYL